MMLVALVAAIVVVAGVLLLGRVRSGSWPAAILYCLLVLLIWSGLAEALGRPKSMRVEWRPIRALDLEVVGVHLDEPRAIYVWVLVPDESDPRAYRLPWSRKAAERAQAAKGEAEKEGVPLMLRMSSHYEGSLDDREPLFYAAPQPALPPKVAP